MNHILSAFGLGPKSSGQTQQHSGNRPLWAIIAATLLACLPFAAWAQVGTIHSPLATQGLWDMQYNLTSWHDDRSSLDNRQTHSLLLAYGLTERWVIVAGVSWRDTPAEDFACNSVFTELKRELTDQKDGWWLSSGVQLDYYRNVSGASDQIEGKLLFQKKHFHRQFCHRANLSWQADVGPHAQDGVQLRSRWLSRWEAYRHFKPAVEWHVGWGDIDDLLPWAEQKQFIGPAIHGELWKGRERGWIGYEVACLFGITESNEDGILRFKLEWVF